MKKFIIVPVILGMLGLAAWTWPGPGHSAQPMTQTTPIGCDSGTASPVPGGTFQPFRGR